MIDVSSVSEDNPLNNEHSMKVRSTPNLLDRIEHKFPEGRSGVEHRLASLSMRYLLQKNRLGRIGSLKKVFIAIE